MYSTFESIKNWQRYKCLKIFVIPGGNTPPTKFSRGDTSATLPNRNGRYQGTTCTSWLNFYTPCKSQLQNAWAVSPTIDAAILHCSDTFMLAFIVTPKSFSFTVLLRIVPPIYSSYPYLSTPCVDIYISQNVMTSAIYQTT